MSGGGGVSGGKRGVNVELNLVPFIDLLSTLICFLLITAVWQQVSVVSTNSPDTTSSDHPAPPDPKKVDLSITLLLDRIETVEGQKITKIPNIGADPDYATLLRVLDEWKQRYPDRTDLTLNSDSQGIYKHLIRVMDTASEAQFADVGVNTN